MLPPGPSSRSYMSSRRSGLLLTVHALLRDDLAKSICSGACMPAGVWLHRGAPVVVPVDEVLAPAAAADVSDNVLEILKDSGVVRAEEDEEVEDEDDEGVVVVVVVDSVAYPARREVCRLRRARRLRARPARHGGRTIVTAGCVCVYVCVCVRACGSPPGVWDVSRREAAKQSRESRVGWSTNFAVTCAAPCQDGWLGGWVAARRAGVPK